MLRVLQLSDLHFGASHGFAQLGDARPLTLAAVIERSLDRAGQDRDFEAIVFNGDLFTQNTAEERAFAEDGVKRLLRSVTAPSILAVPGNHDLSWDPKLRPEERLGFYGELMDQLAPDLPRPAQYPHVVAVDGDTTRGLCFVLLDSCRIESEVQAGLGYVGTDQLDLIERRLADAGVSNETHVVIAIQHHHLLPVSQELRLPPTLDPDASPRVLVSITVDATDVLRELARVGVQVVMHGHQHVHAVMTVRDRRWEPPESEIHVAACGSCGAEEAGVRRHFNIWEFSDEHATVKGFVEAPDDRQLFIEGSKDELEL